jgi:Tol biopolymer transport system component
LGGWSPDGRILFSRIGDGFWTVNADGSDAQPIDLPDFPADAGGPRLSPDGSSLAFNVLVDGNSEVQVRDLATGRTRLVVHRANLPTWSPSGNEILVIGGPTSAEHPGAVTGSFVLVDTATGETRDAPGLSQAAFDLDFSPEGRTVVYASEETGRRQIYTFDISTGEVHQLTSGLEAGAPTWSPDGRTIAYTEFVDGRRAIVTVPADRLERRTILPATTDAIHPSFSPDGSEIAYNALLGPDQGIFVFDLSAGEVQRLTSGPDVNPDWSPDRDVLVFEHGEAGKFELWTVRPDGTGARRLYTAETSTGLPKFDPSGTSIAFLQGSGDGRFDLYVLDMATGDARFVLAGVEAFAWDPSGQLLVKTIS